MFNNCLEIGAATGHAINALFCFLGGVGLSRLLIFILAFAALLAAALIWPVRLSVNLRLNMPEGAKAQIKIRFYGGLFHLAYMLEANLLKKPSLFVFINKGDEKPRVVWRPGLHSPREGRMKLPLKNIYEHVLIKRLHISGEIGVKDDAFLAVMLTGAFSVALECVLLACCAAEFYKGLSVKVLPNFTKDIFSLNLEGIADCPPIHIISAILIWHLKNRKGQKAAWHILSKTS